MIFCSVGVNKTDGRLLTVSIPWDKHPRTNQILTTVPISLTEPRVLHQVRAPWRTEGIPTMTHTEARKIVSPSRSHVIPRDRHLFRVDAPARAEVRELEAPAEVVRRLDEDVLGLDVPVEDALPVHVVEGLEQLVHVAADELLETGGAIRAHDDEKGGGALVMGLLTVVPLKGVAEYVREGKNSPNLAPKLHWL